MTLIELALVASGSVVLVYFSLIGTGAFAFCRHMRAIERDEHIEAAEYMQPSAGPANDMRRAA